MNQVVLLPALAEEIEVAERGVTFLGRDIFLSHPLAESHNSHFQGPNQGRSLLTRLLSCRRRRRKIASALNVGVHVAERDPEGYKGAVARTVQRLLSCYVQRMVSNRCCECVVISAVIALGVIAVCNLMPRRMR